jgi:hypothetical protein
MRSDHPLLVHLKTTTVYLCIIINKSLSQSKQGQPERAEVLKFNKKKKKLCLSSVIGKKEQYRQQPKTDRVTLYPRGDYGKQVNLVPQFSSSLKNKEARIVPFPQS